MLTLELDNFDIKQICDSGQCFRMKQIEENKYAIIAGDKYLEITQKGTIVDFDCAEEEFLFYWINYFDLDADYSQYIEKINPRDKYLTKAAENGKGIRIFRQDLWEMIITFLISQQNNITRIKKCIENLCQCYGTEKISHNGKKYHAFPEAKVLAEASEEDLRACNLGYRAKYVKKAAELIAANDSLLYEICEMKPKKARQTLMGIYGIGEKVADCICLFSLHHMDSFPVDTHIRQVLEKHYKRGFPNRRYKGIRGILQQYIFYYELTNEPKFVS